MANNIDNVGLFLPSTYEFDVGQVNEIDVNSDEFKELIVRLYQNINSIIIATNLKETGYYVLTEFVTGKQWYPDPTLTPVTSSTTLFRPAYRKVIRFGALVNNATKSVAHGITITDTFRLKIIDCVANRPQNTGAGIAFSAVPVPYASTLQPVPESIEIFIGPVNINIATTSVVTNWAAYTDVDVILEYITY